MHELCALIETERDQQKFIKLCEELNRILDDKEQRLEERMPDTGPRQP
jgi:hypothetical protein